jgi:hypothetical protein
MEYFSFEERRKEIVSLLEAGKEEFDKGNPLAALSIIFEAQCVLSETFQREMEKAEGSAATVAASECCSDVCPTNIGSDLLH